MANKNVIMDALGEAREHLILNKFNEAMMLMAQITIDVIEHLTDEALIVSKGYEEDLKTLTAMGILSEDTSHNFNTLIISGVQAHNGVDIPKEHAEQALEVLSNELDLIFKREEEGIQITDNLTEKAKFNANTKNDKDAHALYEYDEGNEPYPGDFSKDMTVDGSAPAFMQTGMDEDDFRKKERMREQMLSDQKRKGKRHSKIIAILLPIIVILLLVFVVKAAFFSGDPNSPKAKRKKQIETTEVIETTETTETEPTTEPLPKEAGYYDVTGDLVKIRNQATTDGSKVIGTVNKGDKVQVKSFYNNDWAIVTFEGRDAYISRRYIRKDESLSPIFEESAVIVDDNADESETVNRSE